MKLPDEIYAVVLESDGSKDRNPIILESYLHKQSSREDALERVKFVKDYHKKEATIARLVFDKNDQLIERLKSLERFELLMTYKVIIETDETDHEKLNYAVEMIPASRNQNVRILDHELVNIEINHVEPTIDLTDAMTNEEIAQCKK